MLILVSSTGFVSAQTSNTDTATGTENTLNVDLGNGHIFHIPYSITGATVTNVKADTTIPKMVISISATADGQITLQVPGESNQNDFTVIVDGQPVQFTQSFDNGHRMVTISFHATSSTIEIVGNQRSQSMTNQTSVSCTQDEISSAKQGLSDLQKKMSELRTQYHNDWQTAYNSGQYNGTWEQYSHEKIMNSSDIAQLKLDYQKYSSILRACGEGHMQIPYSNSTCNQSDITNAREELVATMKQGLELNNKMYQQFQQDQSLGQFNGTWNQYTQEKLWKIPEVVQLKAVHDKYTSFLQSCFVQQMPPPQSETLQNSDNNMPPSNDDTLSPTSTADPDLSSTPSDNLDQSTMGNDTNLGDNNTIQPSDQSTTLPTTISSATDALGTMSSSQTLPVWVKGIAAWWAEGKISDSDFVTAIKFLIHSGIIKV